MRLYLNLVTNRSNRKEIRRTIGEDRAMTQIVKASTQT
jgi:hypothetical protein